MYLQNELLLSVPLAVYVLLRVRSLFGSRLLKNLWTVAFVLIAAGYPVAETLSHAAADGWAGAVALFGYYALPLVLYLVMTVIAVDMAVGLLRLVRLVSREAVRSRAVPDMAAGPLAWASPSSSSPSGPSITGFSGSKNTESNCPRRASAARELTIVFMADLHFRDLTSDRFLEELTAKVNAQKPDLILLGGDLLEGDRRGEDTGRYERAFRGHDLHLRDLRRAGQPRALQPGGNGRLPRKGRDQAPPGRGRARR